MSAANVAGVDAGIEAPSQRPPYPANGATAAFESGYGTLLRNVAASIETSDPDAAQAVARAARDVEGFVSENRLLREYVSATNAGRSWIARVLP